MRLRRLAYIHYPEADSVADRITDEHSPSASSFENKRIYAASSQDVKICHLPRGVSDSARFKLEARDAELLTRRPVLENLRKGRG